MKERLIGLTLGLSALTGVYLWYVWPDFSVWALAVILPGSYLIGVGDLLVERFKPFK